MSTRKGRSNRLRSMGRVLAMVGLFAVPLAFAACQTAAGQGTSPTETVPAATPAPTQQPTPTPTPPPATPTPVPGVTQEQAQSLVRGWFDAVTAGDYQKAQSLTTGNATEQTKQIGDTIQSQASQRGITIEMSVQRLDLSPAPKPAPDEQAVNASFTVQVIAVKGPLSIPAQTLQGSATFAVQPTSGGPKISDIQNVSGLPGQ